MTNKEKAQNNYDRGLWTIEMLDRLVEIGKLTAEEFKEITGEDFIEA